MPRCGTAPRLVLREGAGGRGGDPPGDFTSAALVFRAIGRPGVVLVTEGPPPRATRLAESERKRVDRVAPNVPVHVLRTGDGEDEVPVRKLAKKIGRMRPELTKAEVDAVNKRLKALGGVKMPVPKGMDPTRARPDRKADARALSRSARRRRRLPDPRTAHALCGLVIASKHRPGSVVAMPNAPHLGS